jgi:hypothetical protein
VDADKLTLGAFYLDGMPEPFYTYVDMAGDPDPTPLMDRKMLFDFMGQTNIEKFQMHGRSVEIEFQAKAPEEKDSFALEGDERDTVDGEKIVWDVTPFGGKCHRMGYEDVKLLTPDGTMMFNYNVQRRMTPEDPGFETYNVETVRTMLDETKSTVMTMQIRLLKETRRRMGSFLKSFGGDMFSGLYDEPKSTNDESPKP